MLIMLAFEKAITTENQEFCILTYSYLFNMYVFGIELGFYSFPNSIFVITHQIQSIGIFWKRNNEYNINYNL